MSRINDLIKELCPNGVIYKKYGDVFEIKTGKGITTKEATDDGLYPIISGGTTPMGYYHSYNRDENIVTVSRVGANAGYVNFITEKFYLNDKCFSIIPKDEFVKYFIPKYIYHYTKNIENKIMELQSEGGVPTINTQKVSNLLMPMLPIDVQLEIITVLDKFGELEVELEAELEARKSQYEFWRGKLLNKKNNNYKKYNITEICKSISAGGDVPEDTIKGISKSQDDYKYPVISNGVGDNAIYGYSKNYRVDVQSCVTIAARGTIGYHEVRYGKFTPIIRLITLIPDEKIISAKYLHYALYGHEFKPSGGGIPQLTTPTVKQLDLIIPPVEEQNRIVGILDKFDKLVNDITDGLPAEIELRRKQYEYYRNKLLNFEDIQYE